MNHTSGSAGQKGGSFILVAAMVVVAAAASVVVDPSSLIIWRVAYSSCVRITNIVYHNYMNNGNEPFNVKDGRMREFTKTDMHTM